MVHCVFATKRRRILIPSDLKRKLWPYMAGIARMNKFKALAAGGMESCPDTPRFVETFWRPGTSWLDTRLIVQNMLWKKVLSNLTKSRA